MGVAEVMGFYLHADAAPPEARCESATMGEAP